MPPDSHPSERDGVTANRLLMHVKESGRLFNSQVFHDPNFEVTRPPDGRVLVDLAMHSASLSAAFTRAQYALRAALMRALASGPSL